MFIDYKKHGGDDTITKAKLTARADYLRLQQADDPAGFDERDAQEMKDIELILDQHCDLEDDTEFVRSEFVTADTLANQYTRSVIILDENFYHCQGGGLLPMVIDYHNDGGDKITGKALFGRMCYLKEYINAVSSDTSKYTAEIDCIQNIFDRHCGILDDDRALIREDYFTESITNDFYECGWLGDNIDPVVESHICMEATALSLRNTFHESVQIKGLTYYYHTG